MPTNQTEEQESQPIANNDVSVPEDIQKRIDRLDFHIKFEFELMAQRITYLAISESFLFSAYTLALANYYNEKSVETVIRKVVNALPWVGVSLSVVVFLGVFAAISMTFTLKKERKEIDDSKASSIAVHKDIGFNSWEHYFGLLPPLGVCIAFFVAWICVWPCEPLPQFKQNQVTTITSNALIDKHPNPLAANPLDSRVTLSTEPVTAADSAPMSKSSPHSQSKPDSRVE